MLKWLLFDLNSFFASCEQQVDPTLRGKPVAVVPMLADSTCVIAASYDAKKFGIKTGTRVSDAKKMCPGLILKAGNHKLYTEFHHKIVKAVEEVLPIKKVLSIDEVACEFIGQERQFDNAKKIAQQMKDHVQNIVGSEIKSSVGIGPNILIAKIASDMQKPDGLVLIPTNQILEKIGSLQISDLPGVGRQMKYRLNAKGYFIIADLMKTPEHELKTHWGSIWGLRIAKELKGEDIPYQKNPNQHSLSHEHVLPPEFRSPEKALQVATKLLAKGSERLRDEKMKTKCLSISIKYFDSTYFEHSVTFNESNDLFFLNQELQKLWNIQTHKKPIKVGISLSNLIHGPVQMSLFDNPKTNPINSALDEINSKYGPNTLFLASTKEVLGSAKTRISFNHIPQLKDEFDDI